MFQSTYSSKAVLVTGHTGFKGGWLSIWLLRLGARVVGYSLDPPTAPSLFESSGLATSLHDVRGDIRDTEKLARVIGETRPDFIFHLAAAPLVLDSYTNPLETFDVNVMGTLSVLEAIRRSGSMCSMIAVSTDKCYANREWEYGYREHDPLGGRDPYSASKAAMEIAVASFRDSFFSHNSSANAGVRVASARAGNVLGGGDWASNRIVPDIIRAFHAHEVLSVRSPRAIRPWQHVLEPLSGYMALGAALASSGGEKFASAWNFGPNPTDVFTVTDLVETIVRVWGSGAWRANTDLDAPPEAGLLRLSIDKATSRLGWRPVWSFEETITRTIRWYSRYLASPEDCSATYASCIADIAAYESAACEKGVAWAQQGIGAAARS